MLLTRGNTTETNMQGYRYLGMTMSSAAVNRPGESGD
jgi:hypothetical protein